MLKVKLTRNVVVYKDGKKTTYKKGEVVLVEELGTKFYHAFAEEVKEDKKKVEEKKKEEKKEGKKESKKK